MYKSKKVLACFIIIILLGMYWTNFAFAATSHVQQLKNGINEFPDSYKVLLNNLAEVHPNWTFQAYYTGIDWSLLEKAENACLKNTIYKSSSIDPKMLCVCGKKSDPGYYCASKAAVNYYLDPRNFLNEKAIFQFLELSYNPNVHTLANIEAATKNSFLSGNVNGTTYSQIILEAAKQSGENPISIVIKIFQEIGRGTKKADGTYILPNSVSGINSTYPNCYNFFNYGASDGAGAVERGLAYAQSHGWINQYTAIIEGAKLLSSTYIKAGQNTKYFFKFDVVGTSILDAGQIQTVSSDNLFNHQYMTNVQDPNNQASMLFQNYTNNGMLNENLTFIIPIYNNMPGSNKLPSSLTTSDGELYFVNTKSDPLNLRATAGSRRNGDWVIG